MISRKLFFAVLALLLATPLKAQLHYVVDAVHGKSAAAYTAKPTEKGATYKMIIDQQIDQIPNGTEVSVATRDTAIEWMYNPLINKKVWYGYVLVNYDGKTMYVEHNDLVWSDKNPEGAKNFYKADAKHHTPLGHFYNTMTPFWLIFLLMALTMSIGFLMAKKGAKPMFVVLFPLFMLGGVALELGGVYALGKDLLWWLDPKVYGWGRAVIGIILFGLTICIQTQSIKLYQNGLTRGKGGLSVWAPVIGSVLGVVLFVAGIAIEGYSHDHSNKWFYIGIVAMLISVLAGVVISLFKNIRELGFMKGLAFSIFAIIYGAGIAAATTLFILGFFKVFLETILSIIGFFAFFMVTSKIIPSYSYRDGDTIVEVYEDFRV